jgi:predicted nucleic acid-binding protein
LYLDASALLPLFIQESRTDEAHEHLRGNVLLVSDFAIAEFSSGVARRARTGDIKESDATVVFANFDAWIADAASRENLTAGDLANATALVRRVDLGLRAPDAINIAITQRCGAHLLTFDAKMVRSARILGVTVVGE